MHVQILNLHLGNDKMNWIPHQGFKIKGCRGRVGIVVQCGEDTLHTV